jgi:hypothetical protein
LGTGASRCWSRGGRLTRFAQNSFSRAPLRAALGQACRRHREGAKGAIAVTTCFDGCIGVHTDRVINASATR